METISLGQENQWIWFESKVEINTTILGDEPGMSKDVKILSRKLCWHDGVGISYEAEQKHAEAIIRETGASNLTCLKISMSKENQEEVRDKTRHCGEAKIGKVGHEGTATDRTDFEPCRNHSVWRSGRICHFSCH